MTLTELVERLPGVTIVGSSAIMNGKYVGHSSLDSINFTDYGRELLEAPVDVEPESLPVLDPVKGKGGKKAKPAEVVDPLSVDVSDD